jgi:ATP-dependent DNA helicase RecQ
VDSELRAEAQAVLAELAGPEAVLRDDQWQAIEALVAHGRRVLCVQRTGWGKSAVYFIATVLLRARGEGPTVIVSPLLALMRNQVEAASRAGIAARTINSANLDEWDDTVTAAHAGEVDLLLISPERLNNPDFRDALLPKLADTAGLLVVDEAHCISDWGHDFRPDYRRLRTLLDQLSPDTPVLATTATANARVTADVAEQLGRSLSPADPGGPAHDRQAAFVLRGPLDRESLRLGLARLPGAAHRLAWLADHLGQLPGSGIIYTLTVAAAHETAEFLRARGFPVSAYTGRSEDSERREAEADLLANRLKALVATSALGMGFDKPDVGFVVHLGAPPSPIAYYQQVGRAGRAVERAEVVLLPGREDEAIWAYFASLAFPPEEQVRAVLDVLGASDRALSTPALEARVDLRRTRLELMLKVLDVDGAVRRVTGGWIATGEPWTYDRDRLRRVAEARTAEQELIRGYALLTDCRMEYLRRCLDDPGAVPCGRCDNCTGIPVPVELSPETLAAAERHLGRPGVEVEPRRMWPTGLPAIGVARSGRIPVGEQAAPGRALGRLSDLGWGERLRRLLAPDAPDEPAGDDLLAALVEVLKSWDWATRPGSVVTIGSGRHPRLIRSVGKRIAAIGRLTPLGEVPSPGPGSGGRANSAQRVRALYGNVTVPDALASRVAAQTSPVLLVDDLVDSGWTMALVAGALRRSGATGVLPLVLATSA